MEVLHAANRCRHPHEQSKFIHLHKPLLHNGLSRQAYGEIDGLERAKSANDEAAWIGQTGVSAKYAGIPISDWLVVLLSVHPSRLVCPLRRWRWIRYATLTMNNHVAR